jgi:hypothetical protein
MATYPVLFLNTTTGRPERLDNPADYLLIDKIDCAAAASSVILFPTVTAAGTPVTILANFDGTTNFGKVGGTTAFIGSVTIAQNFTLTGNALLNGNITLGNNLLVDTTTFTSKVASDVVFEGSGPRSIDLTSQNLTIRTITGGDLVLTAAALLNVDGNSIDIDSATTMSLSSVGAAEIKTTGAATDLTLGGRASTITLNSAAPNNALVGFTATSIVGALNEVRAAVGNDLPVYLASEGIAYGDVVCLDWDAGNARVGVYLADNTNAARTRPVGISKNNALLGAAVTIVTSGEAILNSAIVANTEGEYLYLSTVGAVVQAPPGVGTVTIIGIGSKAGIAGVAQCIYQVHIPYTL